MTKNIVFSLVCLFEW